MTTIEIKTYPQPWRDFYIVDVNSNKRSAEIAEIGLMDILTEEQFKLFDEDDICTFEIEESKLEHVNWSNN